MRPRFRVTFVLMAVLLMCACVFVFPAPTSAEESVEETQELRTITLQPGDNFVGWVDESITLDELLAQLPGIERVSTWVAVEQREIVAVMQENGTWSGPLQTLKPGSAYVIRLGGTLPVEWTRPIVPVAGLIELRTGENWAAWLGPDGWTIADVAKGIGAFLSEIRLGDHVYDPSDPETANARQTVSRGDPLVVTVRRGVNWLQPTYVLPKLIFAGSVHQETRNDAKRDLADMSA